MNSVRMKQWTIIGVDIIIFALSVFAFQSIIEKPAIPVIIDGDLTYDSLQSVASVSNSIPDGARLISVNEVFIAYYDEIEFICDRQSIGDSIELCFHAGTGVVNETVILVPYYNSLYIIIIIIVYLIFIIPAVYVLWRKTKDKASIVFHWCAMFSAFFIVFTWGRINTNNIYTSIILRLLFDFSQIMLANLLFHFSLVFPSIRFTNYKKILIPVYVLSIRFIILTYFNTAALLSGNVEDFRLYNWCHHNIHEIGFIAIVLLALIIFFRTLIVTSDEVEKRKMKWVVFGVLAGTMAYIVLWQLPIFIIKTPLIPEWAMLLLTSIAPITFSISIIRYRIFNIDFIISKSMIYGIALLMVAAISLGLDYFVGMLIPEEINSFINILTPVNRLASSISLVVGTIIAIVIFERVKNNLQRFIDKKLFKIKYGLYTSHLRFIDALKECFVPEDVSRLFVKSVTDVIPVDKIAFIIIRISTNEVITSEVFNYVVDNINEKDWPELSGNILCSNIIAKDNILEDEIKYCSIEDSIIAGKNIDILIHTEMKEINLMAIVMLGHKKSRFRYTHEEIEYLKSKIIMAANEIDKIELRTKLALNQEEVKRHKELSELKSRFVSSVSHELKTPLTSIRLFTEMMKLKEYGRSREVEFLDIIQSECDRLNRLINNVLTFSKMEKGKMKLRKENIDLNEIALEVYNIFKSQEKYRKFRIESDFHAMSLIISCDRDSVVESIINLISNSIKYSGEDKKVIIKTAFDGSNSFVSVTDNGFGISDEDKGQLFDEYYRSVDEKRLQIAGTGLGLSIVRNIMTAHNGIINIDSVVGVGSTFSLLFPSCNLNNIAN